MNLNEEIYRIKSIMGLGENLQQAEKLYFKDNKLSPQVKEEILKITNGDNFTRLVTDLYYHITKNFGSGERNELDEGVIKLCKMFHEYLMEYDKNLFPAPGILEDYGLNKPDNFHILTLFGILKERHYLVKQWNELPGIVKRNLIKPMKDEIKLAYGSKDRTYLEYEYEKLTDDLKEINKLLPRLPKSSAESMIKKIFSSVKSMSDIQKTVKNISNTLSFIDDDNRVEKESLLDNLQYYNVDLILDKNNVVVVKANDVESIQHLGCFSSWCFSQFGGEGYWDEYAPDGYVYVIFDFNKDTEDARFLMTFLPDSHALYLSNNIPYDEVYPEGEQINYLASIGVPLKYLI
jgi:hypothetical protein